MGNSWSGRPSMATRPPSGEAVAAAPTDDVPLGSHDLAGVDRRHSITQLHNLADELVADDQRGMDRRLGPLVPGLDVQVGAADARAHDADQHLAGTGLRIGYVPQPQARRRLRFDERLHSGQDSRDLETADLFRYSPSSSRTR